MRSFSILLSSLILFASCSLRYQDVVNVDDVVPEIYYEDAELIRYEDNDVTMKLTAGVLEQYKNSSQNYSKDVSFAIFDDGKAKAEGKCGYLFSDSDAGEYTFFNAIELVDFSENTSIFADILSWNEKTEQLKSAAGSKVRIKKDDTEIEGTGFAASGISRKFRFSGKVSGDIQTK